MRHTGITVVACVLFAAAQASAFAAQAPVVSTQQGRISGVVQNGADTYLGIPYARPPVGPLRWHAPVRPASWHGVRDGSKFGPNCYQDPPRAFGPYTPEFLVDSQGSEDCLYLNVWTPATHGPAKPVLFWIHGGGFGSGSAAMPIYNGSRLAAKGVVVVGINYRLGVFGFLAHPELTAESPRHTSGNYGLLDMIAALRWVQQNIAQFGGDPRRVTIVGQSAGAGAVNDLLLTPDAKGLFVAGIAESGSGGGGAPPQTLAQAEGQGAAIANKLGAHSLAELRAASAEALLDASRGPPPGGPPGIRMAPVVDGQVLPAAASDPAARLVSNVPLLTGFNIDEVGLAGRDHKTSQADFEAAVHKQYGAHADPILTLYDHGSDEEASGSALQLARDRTMGNLVLWAQARARRSGEPIYAYVWDHPYPVPDSARWGAFHTSEVPYVFGALDTPDRAFTDQDKQVSDQIQSYWINFMRRGNPNPPGQSSWPRVTAGSAEVMELGDHPGVRPAVSSPERLAALHDAAAGG